MTRARKKDKEREVPRMARLYRRGRTMRQIAFVSGRSAETVRRWLHEAGVEIRPRGVPRGKYGSGRSVDKSGYVLILAPGHRNANCNGCVREHRLVMEKHLGRYLEPHEVVHHINGVKGDNRLENLRLYERHAEHFSEHMRGNQYWRARKTRNPGPPKLTIEEMAELYRSGKSVRAVADLGGTTSTTLLRRFHDAGVKIRSLRDAGKMRWSRDDKKAFLWKETPGWTEEAILEKYEAGESLGALARLLGTTPQTLRRYLHDRDVKTRSNAEQLRLQSEARRERLFRAIHPE